MLSGSIRKSPGAYWPRQAGHVDMGPQLLVRIEVRRVRRQPHKAQPGAMQDQSAFDHATAVHGQAIPQQDDAALKAGVQRLQESDDLRTADRAGITCGEPSRATRVTVVTATETLDRCSQRANGSTATGVQLFGAQVAWTGGRGVCHGRR
jgi:hypothetical protein